MHTKTFWLPTDIISIPAIDIDELRALIEADHVATSNKAANADPRGKGDERRDDR